MVQKSASKSLIEEVIESFITLFVLLVLIKIAEAIGMHGFVEFTSIIIGMSIPIGLLSILASLKKLIKNI